MYDKYPYFENKQEFQEFMNAQLEEIYKYKWIESEKAGYDLGIDCVFEWIMKFSKTFFEEYIKNKKRGN